MAENLREMTIDERTYATVLMPPIHAVALHARLMGVLGGAAGKAVTSSMQDRDQAISVILGAMSGLEPKAFQELVVDVIGKVSISGEKLDKGNFDAHFAAYPADLYPLTAWVIYENVKGFLAQSGPGWNSLIKTVGSTFPKIGKSSIS